MIKQIGWKTLGVLLAIAAVVAAVGLFWLRFRGAKINGLEAQIRVLQATTQVKVLEAKQDDLRNRGIDHAAKADDLMAQIKDVRDQRKALESKRLKAKGASANEIDARLAKLGF